MKKLLLFFLLFVCVALSAQHKDSTLRLKALHLDSLLAVKYNTINYDTNYIGRPNTRKMFKFITNLSGSGFNIDGAINDIKVRSKVRTEPVATISVEGNYRDISAEFSINPGSISGRNKDYEYNLNAYTNRYGVDVVYQNAKTLSGDITAYDTDFELQKGKLGLRMLTVNGYYAFNGRRFSYPAAFSQSYTQKQSAGSWLLAMSFIGGRIKTTKERSDGVPEMRIYVGHLAFGGGYGYNFVCSERLLFHISATPTIVISNHNNMKIDGERRHMKSSFPDLILAERASLVYNFSHRCFMAATLVMNNSLLGNTKININYNKWRLRYYLGVRL